MLIEIENTSSPGASFTDNTNNVLLKTYEWICEHEGITLPFREFRMRLQSEKGINDNNNRNIYPLLKNGELVHYEKGADLYVSDFYTNTGLAYVKTLQAEKMLVQEEYDEQQKKAATIKLQSIRENIICGALQNIVKKPDINYVEPFVSMIRYLARYGEINKIEFAYLVHMKSNYDTNSALVQMNDVVYQYRDGDIEFEVDVKVRNDIELREKTNRSQRKEGLTYLTSYGYFTSLLQQAGLICKKDKYFRVVSEKREILCALGGIDNE